MAQGSTDIVSDEDIYVDLHPNEIRLIEIQDGAWQDEICCIMKHAPLANKPKYNALSYAWGSPKACRSITFQRRERLVTANLHSALRRLRQQFGSVLVWIDALSINQTNVLERNHQVRMMRDIFQNADTTVIYFGEVLDPYRISHSPSSEIRSSTKTVFGEPNTNAQLLSAFESRYLGSSTAQSSRRESSRDAFGLIGALSDTSLFDKTTRQILNLSNEGKAIRGLIEAIRQLGRCRWWTRVWTVQESVVPKQLLVIYGSSMAPWSMFVHAAKQLDTHINSSSPNPGLVEESALVLRRFSSLVLDVDIHRGQWINSADESNVTLNDLLTRFGSRGASDPRDKVYALLGLFRRTSPLEPDYSLSVARVFTDATFTIIDETRSLDILITDTMRKSRRDLPTWVRDWTNESTELDHRRAFIVSLYKPFWQCPLLVLDPFELRRILYVRLFRSFRVDPSLLKTEKWLVGLLDQLVASAPWLTQAYNGPPLGSRDWDNWSFISRELSSFANVLGSSTDRRSPELKDLVSFIKTLEAPPEPSLPWHAYHNHICSVISMLDFGHGGKAFYSPIGSLMILDGVRLDRILYVGRTNASETSLPKLIQEWLFGLFVHNKHVDAPLHDFARTICAGIAVREQDTILCHLLTRSGNQDIVDWLIHLGERFLPIMVLISSILKSENLESARVDVSTKDGHHNEQTRVNAQATIELATSNRAFFVTKEGYLGLGPSRMMIGDEVLLLGGANSPFVLRPRGNYWSLLGDCYLDGFMESSPSQNLMELKWQPITIE